MSKKSGFWIGLIAPPSELVGFPDGEKKIVISAEDFASVLIQTPNRTIRTFPRISEDGKWHYDGSVNQKIKQ